MKKSVQIKLLLVSAVVILVVVVLAVGCSPRQNENPSGDSEGSDAAAVAIEWTPESDCTVCHATEATSENNAEALYGFHVAQSSELSDCAECHDDEKSLTEVHEGITATDKTATKLKKTEVTTELCLGCHEQADLIAKTAGSTVLTDSNGTAVNPHDLPANDDHASINCLNCHKMHAGIDTEEETASKACLSCHHAGVHECGTCHE